MANLNKLAVGTTANSADVAGPGADGNDDQLRDLLLAIRNKHKSARWSNYVITDIVRDLVQDGSGDDDSRTIQGAVDSGSKGMWIRNVTIFVARADSTSQDPSNEVAVRMYKDTNSNWDISSLLDLGKPKSSAVDIVPSTTIRAIQGVDDGKHYYLPIANDFIATGERWALRLTAPTDTSMGWEEAHIAIQVSELHIA
tara:strand:- start:1477 stop:2070 length:594 start_codon:yes stop_codon:yes gene_type:complete